MDLRDDEVEILIRIGMDMGVLTPDRVAEYKDRLRTARAATDGSSGETLVVSGLVTTEGLERLRATFREQTTSLSHFVSLDAAVETGSTVLPASRPASAETAERPPKRIGRFQIQRELGRGGMGVVYRAHDRELDVDVALKVLPRHVADDPAKRKALLAEARNAALLRAHANIVSVYEAGCADGHAYVAMELIDGKPLSAFTETAPLPAEKAASLLRQVAAGIAAAHQSGLVHRDIKPANIMVTPAGVAKILDFGLARNAAAPGIDLAHGVVAGTPVYMPPEVLAMGIGAAPYDADAAGCPALDVYAFGVTATEVLTGANPFAASRTWGELLERKTDPAQLSSIRSAILNTPMRGYADDFAAMLRPNPADRCKDGAEVVRRFESSGTVRGGLPSALAKPKGTPAATIAVDRPKRRRPVAVLAAAAAAVIVAVAAFQILNQEQTVESKTQALVEAADRALNKDPSAVASKPPVKPPSMGIPAGANSDSAANSGVGKVDDRPEPKSVATPSPSPKATSATPPTAIESSPRRPDQDSSTWPKIFVVAGAAVLAILALWARRRRRVVAPAPEPEPEPEDRWKDFRTTAMSAAAWVPLDDGPASEGEVYVIDQRHLEVSFGDIARERVEAWVSSDDTDLSMGGGVSASLRAAAGEGVRAEARAFGKHAPGDVLVTSAGDLPGRFILHALTIGAGQSLSLIVMPTPETIRRCLSGIRDEVRRLDIRSLAIPLLGSGAGGLDVGDVGDIMARELIREFADGDSPLARIVVSLKNPPADFLARFRAAAIDAGPSTLCVRRARVVST